MTTQDSQSELEGLVDRIQNNLTLDEGVSEVEDYVTARVEEAERLANARGIEWGIDTTYTILDTLIENGHEAYQRIEKLKTSLTATTNGKEEYK